MLSFAYLNQPRSCSSVSVAMEEDYIILELRVERRVKKKTVTAERLAQMFGVSHAEDYCNFPCVFAGNVCDNYGGTRKHQNT